MEVLQSRQFAQRVFYEQSAAMRASPVPSYRPHNTREMRLRLEIDLALRAAAIQSRQTRRRPGTEAASPIMVVSSPTRLPPMTARSELVMAAPHLPPLTSAQLSTSIAEAGSKSTRGLQGSMTCRFKNMESPLPFFNNAL